MVEPVRFEWDYRGMARYLTTSTELGAAMLGIAKEAAEYAKTIAPVGPARPHSRPVGEFRDSIRAEPAKTPRGEQGARVVAAPAWVEFGRVHRSPYRGSGTLRATAARYSSRKRSA